MAEQGREDRAASEGELFRLLVENVVDYAIFVIDPEGLVRTWSHGAERLLGYREDEILGRAADVFFTPEDVRDDIPRLEMRQALDTGRGDDDRWHVRKDGTRFWVSGVMTPLRDEGGRLRGFAKIMRDRTEWWLAEQARLEGERRILSILESITDAFFAVDRDWRFTYLNRQAQKLIDPTSVGLVGLSMWEAYPGLVGSEFERAYRRAAEERVAVSVTSYYPDHDRWYEVHAYPSEDGLSVYFRDVTEPKRQEEEHARHVAASERQRRTYETALSNTPDFHYIFDLEGRFVYVNDALLGMWQKGLDEVLGRNLFEIGYPVDLAGLLHRKVQEVIDTKQPVRGETPFTSHLGERQYEYIFVPVLGAGGAVEAVAGSTRDITERKQAEIAVLAAKEEAENANMAKDHFLAVLSHELRTPLNPILLAVTSMLDRPCEPEELRPTLEMIRQNVALQARLIDDLLDVMRIVRGKMPLHWGVSDCHSLIRRAVEICRSEVHARGHRLILDLSAGEHCVNADSARLQQVLWNLLKNAVKFTPEGGTITVSTRNEDGPERADRHRGRRYRDRHRAGGPADDLGAVPAGGDDDYPQVRRPGAGAGDLQGGRRCPRRDAGGREPRRGQGDHVPGGVEDDAGNGRGRLRHRGGQVPAPVAHPLPEPPPYPAGGGRGGDLEADVPAPGRARASGHGGGHGRRRLGGGRGRRVRLDRQ